MTAAHHVVHAGDHDTGITRDAALADSLLATPFCGLPLVICGVLKIAYDVALLVSFRQVKPPEER